MQTPFDQLREKPKSMPVHEPGSVTSSLVLPALGWAAILRGLRGHCPRCGEARLFMRFLKPIPRCPPCAQAWTDRQRVVQGKSVAGRVELRGRSSLKIKA